MGPEPADDRRYHAAASGARVVADGWIAAVLRRDRVLTLAGLGALTAFAWIYLFRLGREMGAMAAMGMAPRQAWTRDDVALTAIMWAVMMAAMMLPSAAPMILVFETINRKRYRESGPPYISTGLFLLSYLVVWTAFSVTAALTQWALHAVALLADDAMNVTPLVGSGLLVAAGVYQLTPLKYACLARCQTPFGFLLSEWREGTTGVIVMGLRHGLFCLGCCWALMALLFVGGIMNLVWVAAIAAFVLVEKLVPAGRLVSWVSGAVLLLAAVGNLYRGL